mmetsp:Transcript_8306/g.16388  ORF Transcript_8306/g.16388 Transcript_8306/m.16388 type:complete len:382 (+) Transcript_8306:23-1168(+)
MQDTYASLSNPEILTGLKGTQKTVASHAMPQEIKERSEAPKPVSERRWQWAYPTVEGVPPSPRGGHTATLAGASLLIFGGHFFAGKTQGFIYLNDTIVLDVNENRWTRPRVNGTAPTPRYGHTAVLAGSRIIYFGGKGEGGALFRDLHALEPSTMTWYQGPEGGNAPRGRLGHTATLVGSRMFIFGGWDTHDFFNDMHVLDLGLMAWTQPATSGPSPCPRMGHAACLVGNNLVIQGGFSYNERAFKEAGTKMGSAMAECYLNDLRVLDTETFTWSRLRVSGVPPKPSYGHSIDISNSDLVLFGGYGRFSPNTPQLCDYFVVLDTERMSWSRCQFTGVTPAVRHGHSATAIGPHILVFGGWESTKALNDVFVIRDLSASAES